MGIFSCNSSHTLDRHHFIPSKRTWLIKMKEENNRNKIKSKNRKKKKPRKLDSRCSRCGNGPYGRTTSMSRLDGRRRCCDNIVENRSETSTSSLLRSWSPGSIQLIRNLAGPKQKISTSDSVGSTSTSSTCLLVDQSTIFREEICELFQQQIGTDMTLKLGNTTIHAHQSIVFSRCADLRYDINKEYNGFATREEKKPKSEKMSFLQSKETEEENTIFDLGRYGIHEYEDELVPMVKSCYGTPTKDRTEEFVRSTFFGGRYFVSDDDGFLAKSDTIWPCDLEIVLEDKVTSSSSSSSSSPPPSGGFYLHSSVLMAHSEYARSFLTHGWHVKRSPDGARKLLLLDSNQFSPQVTRDLICACYTNSLHHTNEENDDSDDEDDKLQLRTMEYLFQLYRAASYLMMKSISMLIAVKMVALCDMDRLPEIAAIATSENDEYLMQVWCKRVCVILRQKEDGSERMLLRTLPKEHLEVILESEDLDVSEKIILDVLVNWYEASTTRRVKKKSEKRSNKVKKQKKTRKRDDGMKKTSQEGCRNKATEPLSCDGKKTMKKQNRQEDDGKETNKGEGGLSKKKTVPKKKKDKVTPKKKKQMEGRIKENQDEGGKKEKKKARSPLNNKKMSAREKKQEDFSNLTSQDKAESREKKRSKIDRLTTRTKRETIQN